MEIPAGKLDDPNEEGIVCAARELKEETGYSSENLEWILTIRTTVAFCDERIEVFVARNLIPGEQSLDEDEFVDVKAYELDELKQMILKERYRIQKLWQQSLHMNQSICTDKIISTQRAHIIRYLNLKKENDM